MKSNLEKKMVGCIGETLRYIEIDRLLINLPFNYFSCNGNFGRRNGNTNQVEIQFVFGNGLNKGFSLIASSKIEDKEVKFELNLGKFMEIDNSPKSIIEINDRLKSVMKIQQEGFEEYILNLANGNSIRVKPCESDTQSLPEIILKYEKTDSALKNTESKILKEYFVNLIN
jgi:hypothetical protein